MKQNYMKSSVVAHGAVVAKTLGSKSNTTKESQTNALGNSVTATETAGEPS